MKSPISFLMILFLFFSSCQSRNDSGYAMLEERSYAQEAPEMMKDMKMESNAGSAYSPDDASEDQSQFSSNALPKERKIIRTAEIKAEVEDLKKSAAIVESKIKKFGGFTGNVQYSNSHYQEQVNYTIRVPREQFDALLADLDEEALYVDYKRISANDVTEEYLDIETRLQTKKDVRDRYIAILRNKAKTVEEVLMAEEKIRVIQEEIESREGRLNYLKNQVSLSTINLNLYQKTTRATAQQPGFFRQLGRAFAEGWEIFLELIIGIVHIWPIILTGFLLFFVFRKIWKKRKS